MEERIVNKALRIDLHIHSSASKDKDGDLVKDSNINNIDVLIKKLKENHIDMFSITDHDKFDYSLYKKFKEYRENEDKDFAKILPGVEFSVGFESNKLDSNGNTISKQIHVIAIFDDSDDKKLQELEKLLDNQTYDIDEKTTDASRKMFKEKTFRDILQRSNLDVCLIAHQKNSVTSKTPRKNDANSVDEEKFNELINFEYFEAFEFKNMNNRIFNELFKRDANREYEKVRFITGSDCHQWEYYPKEKSNSKDGFQATYIKSLPSFRGLVMALTDDSRIQLNSDFYSKTTNYIDAIRYSINGKDYSIPLSKGINTIIGDNSKGKSMFLHTMTNYQKSGVNKNKSGSKKEEYKRFLDNNKIEIDTIKDSITFKFDSQGEIKESFETGNFNDSSFLEGLYPNQTDSSLIVKSIKDYFEKYFKLLKEKFDYDSDYKELKGKVIDLNVEESNEKVLNISKIAVKKENKNLISIISKLKTIISTFEELSNLVEIENDKKLITDSIKEYKLMLTRYEDQKSKFDQENKICNYINSAIDEFIENQKSLQSTSTLHWTTFTQEKENIAESIYKLVKENNFENSFSFTDFKDIDVSYEFKNYDDMKIVSRFKANKAKYDSKYCETLLENCLNKSKKPLKTVLNISDLTKDILMGLIKGNDDKKGSPIDILRNKIDEQLKDDFENKMTIMNASDNDFSDKSSGLNASNYFKVMSYDKSGTVYIVDQPEDDISQKNIRINIIKDLKRMAKNKQIILVTHNPQLVVNLDSDNVIYFSNENGQLKISSGALEYKDNEFDVINCVSDCLEGGIESLKRRWKRYDKNI